MPVEIRELIIRAVAAEDDENAAQPAQTTLPASVLEDIVQECVRQVLKILEKQKDR